MPVAVMTAAEQNEFIGKFESNLGSILEEKGVRRDVQVIIAQLEILNCETFATMEGTSEKFREWLHSSDIGLERTGQPKSCVLGGRRRENHRAEEPGSRTEDGGPPSGDPRRHVRDYAQSLGVALRAGSNSPSPNSQQSRSLSGALLKWTTGSSSQSLLRTSPVSKKKAH